MAVDAVRDTADRLESSAESRRTEHRQRLTRQMLQELLRTIVRSPIRSLKHIGELMFFGSLLPI